MKRIKISIPYEFKGKQCKHETHGYQSDHDAYAITRPLMLNGFGEVTDNKRLWTITHIETGTRITPRSITSSIRKNLNTFIVEYGDELECLWKQGTRVIPPHIQYAWNYWPGYNE